MSTERTKSYIPRAQSFYRSIIPRSAMPRGQSASGRGQSTDRMQLRSRLVTRDASSSRTTSPLKNNKGSSAERPLTSDFHKRSLTISPSRRSNYGRRDTSTTNKGLSGNIKDTRNTTGNKLNLEVKQMRNKIGSDQNETKTTAKLNRYIALIDEVSGKILESNDLNAADLKVLVVRLLENLGKGVKNGNETEPSKLYREDSSNRNTKSEHQHQKVMLNCGLKKPNNKISDKYSKTNGNTKSRFDSDCITFSGNTDNGTGVSGDKKGNVSGNVSHKDTKKSSVNKKKSCEKKTSKPKSPAENKDVDYEPETVDKLTKGVKNGNETEPSKLHREDSSNRNTKSEHQHKKVMLNCGLKKQNNKISDKYSKTNVNSKSRHDSDCITFSGNTDKGTDVSSDKKCNVSGNVSSEVSKKSSVNKKKNCEEKTSKPDYNARKKLPETVDKSMNYLDEITKEQEPEPESERAKKLRIVNERREKMKLWDRQRRLMLETKTEDNSLKKKDDICNEKTSPGLYHKDHDSKIIPNNKGGDIKPPRKHLSTQDMSIMVQRCKNPRRPTTVQRMEGVKNGNKTEPSKLYREDSSNRNTKSGHQHQKVMLNCGLKKPNNKISDKYSKTNVNSKSRYDSGCITFSGNTDNGTGVSGIKKCNVSGNVSSKVSKMSSVNKKKSCEKKTSKPEYNARKKLPETVDKSMNYLDEITKEQEPEPESERAKKLRIVNERREKMKLWDRQRRLMLETKTEDNTLKRKDDICNEKTSPGLYHKDHDSKIIPNNKGGDIKPPRKHLSTQDMSIMVQRCKNPRRPTTVQRMEGVKNGNKPEPRKLYREDSRNRNTKSGHQHQKVMLNCGLKKQNNKISDKYSKTNVNSKSRYDSGCITFSGNTDNGTGVSGIKKCNVSGNVSSKVSKMSSVNKKKSCEKKTSKPDYNARKKLPETVDKSMNSLDEITKDQEPEPESERAKKLRIVNERKEKMKLWDRQRRLMLETKTEDNSLKRKDDICKEKTSPGLYHKDHDSKIIPNNKGGDIKPPRKHLSTQDMSIMVQRCKNPRRPTTVQRMEGVKNGNKTEPRKTSPGLYHKVHDSKIISNKKGGDIKPPRKHLSNQDMSIRVQRCKIPRRPTTVQR